jgi:hypothetical protein
MRISLIASVVPTNGIMVDLKYSEIRREPLPLESSQRKSAPNRRRITRVMAVGCGSVKSLAPNRNAAMS